MPDATYDNQNIFAKILRGELPCTKVYEDEHTLAFMDIMPQADGHVLVLPKEGATELFYLSDEAAAAAIVTTRKLARAVRDAFSAPGIAVFQLNGAAAGQTVPHVHFHVLPRYPGKELHPHARVQAAPETLKAHADKIIAALNAQ